MDIAYTPTRRELIAGAAALAVAGARAEAAPALTVNDASGLNATPVSARIALAGEAQARQAITSAANSDKALSIGGARHSMGGQSLPPAGHIALDQKDRSVSVDPAARTYVAAGGARWIDVIAALDPHRLSPLVMQSNNDFTIGGSISVNAHGWASPHPPLGASVERLWLMLADGRTVECSRALNPDLFALAIGGYGLFGVILRAELRATDNLMLDPSFERVACRDLAARMLGRIGERETVMAYGRLSVAPDGFLQDGLIGVYRPLRTQPTRLPPARDRRVLNPLARSIFRAQTGSIAGRQLRWALESRLIDQVSPPVTRNALLDTSAEGLGSVRGRTDILHEYFVPPDRLEAFAAACRRIIPAQGGELLNITLRYVQSDPVSRLAYAPGERLAAVMLFSQPLTPGADEKAKAMTQALIDAALAQGGSFYLPYRLHARPDQLARAYPGLAGFVGDKRRLDPRLRFCNQMWERYFADQG